MTFPFGSTRIAWLPCSEIADCIAVVISQPSKYTDKVLSLSGSRKVSGKRIAKAISQSISEETKYVDVSNKILVKQLVNNGWSKSIAKEYVHRWRESSVATTEDAKKLLGREPSSVKQWIEYNAHIFLKKK